MLDFFNDSVINTAVAVAILCGLCAFAFFAVSKFRDYAANDQESSDELLANLREMKLKGDITDEEFRTIQASTRLEEDDAINDSENEPTGSEAASE